MSLTCTSCGAEVPSGRRFCDQCGTPVGAACPACGTENRAQAKFCAECGTALAGSATVAPAPPAADPGPAVPAQSSEGGQAFAAVAERRLVSVLFADLVAFTTFSEGRDPEVVRETLTSYFEATRDAIEQHGGRVEKFIGDAVMAEWGAPRANEDDAERAVRAAFEVIEAVRNLGVGLQARVGVLTGQAAVTIGATDQGMVAGDLVNTAARLQALAPPGSVLVGEATMQAAASAIAFEPAGEQLLRGKEAPVAAWRAVRVIGDRGGRSRGEGLDPPFVGREVELRLLKDLLHAIGRERRPRLVSITGPAGIGKSRLAWEFEKYVDGLVEEIYWHRGRAPSYGEGVTFWALGEMVRKRASLRESDDEATTRDRLHRTVLELVPGDEDRARVEPALLTLLGLEPPPPGGRDVLFAAWRTFFERVAAQGTTVMLFEDLQWADSGQLDFIDHLLEWSKGVPILVVTLARPELLERRPGWGTSARSFNTIGLEPLSDEHMRALLAGLVPTMPRSAVDAILARADGIPLYAVEIVRMLIADGRLASVDEGRFEPTGDLGELAVPDSLRALIASRLDALDPADRSLLQDAAVLGKTFSVASLAAIVAEDEAALEPRLRPLVKREVLEISVDPRSPERGQYGFVQSVIREVAYDTLSRRDRRARHLAAARHFESLGEEELAGVLATHYLAAFEASEPGPEADALRIQARLALRAAAERATMLGATDQAVTLLRGALEITDAPAERGELLERAAQAADQEARYDEAGRLGSEAIEAYEAADDRDGVARASALLGGILTDSMKVNEAATFLMGAIARADRPEDQEVRADMLARLSRAHMRLSENEPTLARADEALAIAEPLRLKPVIAEAFINKGIALILMGRLEEGPLLITAAIELAHETGDAMLELRARNNLGAMMVIEDIDEAMVATREAYALATQLGVTSMSQWIAGAVVLGAIEEGFDLDSALRDLDAEVERSPSEADRVRLIGIRSSVSVLRGEDTSEAIASINAWRAGSSDPDFHAWILQLPAEALLVAGRATEALDLFRQASAIHSQSKLDAHQGFIRSALWSRDIEAAREALRSLESEPFAGTQVEGSLAVARAGIAAMEGRSSEAVAGIRSALATYGQGGFRFRAALAQLDALVLLPDEPAIAGWADEARARFEVMKLPPLLARLDEAMARRGSDTAGDSPTMEPASSTEALRA